MNIADYLYISNIILCAVLAGFMVSYSITLGAYFTYMLKNGKLKQLQETYTPFRETTRAKMWYSVWVIAQTVVALLSLIFNAQNHFLIAQIYAVAVFPLYMIFHQIIGFGKVEEKVNSGNKNISNAEVKLHSRYNLPLHRTYAVLYFIAVIWLIVDFY